MVEAYKKKAKVAKKKKKTASRRARAPKKTIKKKALAGRKAERAAAAKRARLNARRRELRARKTFLDQEVASSKERERLAKKAYRALLKRHAQELAENADERAEYVEARGEARKWAREEARLLRRLTPGARRRGLQNVHREGSMIVAVDTRGRNYRPYAVTNTRTGARTERWTVAENLAGYAHPSEMADEYEDLDRPFYQIDFFLTSPAPPVVPPRPMSSQRVNRNHANERAQLRAIMAADRARAREALQEILTRWTASDRKRGYS
jgi:hypothetical protein